jgi:hypothetical protein
MASLLPASVAARVVGILLGAFTGVVMLAYLTAFGVNRLTPVPAWKEFVDIGAEGNLPTWWNATLLALMGATALVAAALQRPGLTNPSTRAWIVVAAAGTYLSIDEAAGLHERLGGLTYLGGIDPPTYAWVVPGSLLAAAGIAILVLTGRSLPSPTAQRLGLALVAYGIGAIGLEAFTGWVRDRGGLDWLFTVGITAEESLEMIAAAYAIIAIVDYCGVRREDPGISLRGPGAAESDVGAGG